MACRWISRLERTCETPRLQLHRCVSLLVVLMIIYTIGWNVAYTDRRAKFAANIPAPVRAIAILTGMNQQWNMFAPQPPTRNIGLELVGITREGREIDLWTMENRHAETPIMVNSHRWRKYLANLDNESFARHRCLFAAWAKARWNRKHGYEPGADVLDVELIVYRQANVPPDIPKPPIQVARLFSATSNNR